MLITVWIRYTRIISTLPVETPVTMLLNAVLLFTISLEPYIFNVLRLTNVTIPITPEKVKLFETASSAYGVDLGAMMLIMGIFTLALADEEKQLVPGSMLSHLRAESTLWFVSCGIFLLSALPLFGRVDLGGVLVKGLSARMVMWLAAILVTWAKRSRTAWRTVVGQPLTSRWQRLVSLMGTGRRRMGSPPFARRQRREPRSRTTSSLDLCA